MHLDESRSKPERRRKAREQYERKGSLVQGGLPRMAGGKEIELEDGMITCETNAAVATPARTVRRLQRPKRAKSAKRVRACPLPEQYAEVLNRAAEKRFQYPLPSPPALLSPSPAGSFASAAKDRDNGDEVLLSHLVTCTKCRAVFRRLLLEMITPDDLRAAREQLALNAPRPGGCPAVEELANYAAWPGRDPLLPRQLGDERRAEIRSHLEAGCPACCKQVEIATRRAARNNDKAR